MKKRIWAGGLLLSLGGWASDLIAQDAPWKPPAPPASLNQPTLSVPIVTLGRPIAISHGTAKNGPQPSGVVPAAYQVPANDAVGGPMNAALPAPGDTLPGWPEDEEPGADRPPTPPGGFAADRGARTVAPSTIPTLRPITIPAAPPSGPAISLGAPTGTRVVQVSHTPELLPPVAVSSAPLACPPLPDGLAAVEHDFWAPDLQADPLRSHFYVAGEFLYWWTKPDHVPPLVTTSDPNNPNANGQFGFLGQQGTQTLFGGGDINGGGSAGVRVTAGYWLDMFQEEGVEISGFLLAPHSSHFSANSANDPVLARPFFNLNANTEFSELVAFPGLSTGNVSVDSRSAFWGVEGNLRCNVCCDCDQRLDVFGGFRYLDLQESITVVENIQGLASAPEPFTNTQAQVFDRFATHNGFYGGQLGADYEYRMGRWFVDVKGKLAIGVTNTTIDINGAQTFFNPDGSVRSTTPGGLLALNSNIGHYIKDRFAFVPEVGVNLGYQVNDNIRVFAGFNFLYWSSVMRPGDQIDRNLDVTRIPNFPVAATPLNTPQPFVPFKSTDFWATGVNIGIEFRY